MGADGNISDLIDAHESVDWRDVPSVSPAEAAAWTQRLLEAQSTLEEADG